MITNWQLKLFAVVLAVSLYGCDLFSHKVLAGSTELPFAATYNQFVTDLAKPKPFETDDAESIQKEIEKQTKITAETLDKHGKDSPEYRYENALLSEKTYTAKVLERSLKRYREYIYYCKSADSYYGQAKYSTAHVNYLCAVAIHKEIFPFETLTLSTLQYRVGACLVNARCYDTACNELLATIKLQEKLLGENHPEMIDTLLALSRSLVMTSDGRARKYVNRALELSLAAKGEHSEEYFQAKIWEFYCNCIINDKKCSPAKALSELQEWAIEMNRELKGIELLQCYTSLAQYYAQIGDFSTAENYCHLYSEYAETLSIKKVAKLTEYGTTILTRISSYRKQFVLMRKLNKQIADKLTDIEYFDEVSDVMAQLCDSSKECFGEDSSYTKYFLALARLYDKDLLAQNKAKFTEYFELLSRLNDATNERDFDKIGEICRRAIELDEQLFSIPTLSRCKLYYWLSQSEHKNAHEDKVLEYTAKWLEICEGIYGQPTKRFLEYYLYIAKNAPMHYPEIAAQYTAKAKELALKAKGDESKEYAWAVIFDLISDCQLANESFDPSKKLAEVETMQKLQSAEIDDTQLAGVHLFVADFYKRTGNFQSALLNYKKVIALIADTDDEAAEEYLKQSRYSVKEIENYEAE
jgi:hypothetical protein